MAKMSFNKAVAIAQEHQEKANRPRYQPMKVTDTPKQIRFITEDEEPIEEYGSHFVKFHSDKIRTYSCPDASGNGESTCKICAVKPGVEVKETTYSRKFALQIVERDAPTGEKDADGNDILADRIGFLSIPVSLMATINEYNDKFGDIGDRDYTIGFIENPDPKSRFKVYSLLPVGKRPSPIDAETQKLIDKRPALADMLPGYDPNDIQKMMTFAPPQELKPDVSKFMDNLEDATPATKSSSNLLADDEDDDDSSTFLANLRSRV